MACTQRTRIPRAYRVCPCIGNCHLLRSPRCTLGWTRQKTLDHLAAHTTLSIHEITTETDRYIARPGRALGYKMRELKIREPRALAEAELGDAFDIRAFHDAVLPNGPVTLPLLDTVTRRWIDTRR